MGSHSLLSPAANDSALPDDGLPDLDVGGTRRTALPFGRVLAVSEDDAGGRIDIVDPRGRVEAAIRLTPEGPLLEIDVLSLRLKARDITISCESLTTVVGRSIHVSCSGDVVESTTGKRHLSSGGGTRIAGRDVAVVATDGVASVRASDDVTIDGTTVRLNS